MDKIKGYIPLARQIQDNLLWSDKPFARGQAWIDLILMANYEDGVMLVKGVPVEVKRGQVFRTIDFLSRRWGWNRKKTINFVKLLENQKMVTSKGTPQGTLITIENYTFYNDVGITDGTTDGTTKGQPRDNQGTQKNKNNKNNKKNIYSTVPAEIREVFMAWADMRKQIKKPITSEKTVKMALAKLNKLSSDPEEQNEIILQAINGCWLSFYPLKDKPKKINYYEAEEEPEVEEMPPEVRANIEKMMKGFDYE